MRSFVWPHNLSCLSSWPGIILNSRFRASPNRVLSEGRSDRNDRLCGVTYELLSKRQGNVLFVPSSLVFGLLEQFFMFMLAHLFLAPFYNITHTLTSFELFPIFFCLIHKGFKLNFRCKRFSPVIRDTQTGDAVLSFEPSHQSADNRPRHATEGHGTDNA